MGKIFSKLTSRERGFTLVEILIAVAILGIVAAVAIPTIANITSRSETKANSGELSNVQAALDAMMSDQEIEAVTVIAQINATNNMGTFPDATYSLNGGSTGDYMRQAITKCTYYVASNGIVSQDPC